jgi:uncharacterized heparinase superfamily protein
MLGSPPIRFPTTVTARVQSSDAGTALDASHDGYMRSFGLMCRRTLTLSEDGRRIVGLDRITPPKAGKVQKGRIPFAVHFHLNPQVKVLSVLPGEAVLGLLDGSKWQLTISGAALAREESIHFADLAGPRQSVQLSARGTTLDDVNGDASVGWALSPVDQS